MGIFEKGYMGGFRGKLGTAVGTTWKGLHVLRSRPPRKRTGPASENQLEVQAKFLLMVKFLQPLTDLLNRTFKKSAVNMSGVNKAFAENKKAITGAYPDFTVDYPKVILSTGSLANGGGPAAKSAEAGKLVFTWTDNSNDAKKTLISDLAFVAAYNGELNSWIYEPKAATRNALSYTLDVAEFSGKTVQTYVGFMSADGRKVSKSLFTGVVNIL
jgi:hypothetical protein